MAPKVLFLLALTAAVVLVNAKSNCICDPKLEIDDKKLWDFFRKNSKDLDDPKDKELHAVLPGMLSPLLECNCLENNRRKRKIMPEVEETTERLNSEESTDEGFLREKKSIHYKTRRCALGQVWIGVMCVPEEFLE